MSIISHGSPQTARTERGSGRTIAPTTLKMLAFAAKPSSADSTVLPEPADQPCHVAGTTRGVAPRPAAYNLLRGAAGPQPTPYAAHIAHGIVQRFAPPRARD